MSRALVIRNARVHTVDDATPLAQAVAIEGERIAWVGTDDNQETGLYGATGALKVWAALFQRLPTAPLKLELGQDPALAWVDMQNAALTDANCPGAREVPFAQGHPPDSFVPCGGSAPYATGAAAEPHKAESLGRRILRWFERPRKAEHDDEQ